MKYMNTILAAMLSLGGAAAQAGTMLAPVTASTNMGIYNTMAIENIINQSGLQTAYTSGVTDFDTYMAGPAGEFHNVNLPRTDWLSSMYVTTGYVDFDLGNVYTISQMAHWVYSNNYNGNVRAFTLLAGEQSDFSDAVTLGTYTATSTRTSSIVSGQQYFAPQIFQFAATDARYVRMNIQSNYGLVLTGMGEVAFDGVSPTPPAAVPEPGALVLMAVGIAGLTIRRRRG